MIILNHHLNLEVLIPCIDMLFNTMSLLSLVQGNKPGKLMILDSSFVIRRTDESQNGCVKKTKHVKFSEKQTFLTSWYAHVRVCVSGGMKCSFFGKPDVPFFFKIHPFALLPTSFEFFMKRGVISLAKDKTRIDSLNSDKCLMYNE